MSRRRLALAGCAAGLMLAAGSMAAKATESTFFAHQQEPRSFEGYSYPETAPAPAPKAVASVAPAAAEPAPAASYPAYSSAAPDGRPMESPIPRETVAYDGPYPAGTIVISTEERRLYYVLPNHQALRYGVGVGRPGFDWAGTKTITAKREWPDWTPPPEMIKRRPDLPRHMAGGIENPLGARAMYLGGTMYRIHGSNEPDTIGQAVSSGCIRMTNDDVADLYEHVKIGTKAVVLR
jgi:lipoprotein-anchoring transpeptidase ErfK/SrfK